MDLAVRFDRALWTRATQTNFYEFPFFVVFVGINFTVERVVPVVDKLRKFYSQCTKRWSYFLSSSPLIHSTCAHQLTVGKRCRQHGSICPRFIFVQQKKTMQSDCKTETREGQIEAVELSEQWNASNNEMHVRFSCSCLVLVLTTRLSNTAQQSHHPFAFRHGVEQKTKPANSILVKKKKKTKFVTNVILWLIILSEQGIVHLPFQQTGRTSPASCKCTLINCTCWVSFCHGL